MANSPWVLFKLVVKGFFVRLVRIRIVVKRLPFQQPSFLLLSFPRSGSSWLGKILATSKNIAYLREPVTQPYMANFKGRFSLVDLDQNQQAHAAYCQLADDAFHGRPPLFPYVVNRISDFHITMRHTRHILVKEINPRALQFYYERYNPKVMLLIRHPAAVALSFHQLGWLDSDDVQLDTGNPAGSVWEKFGYAYGTIMQNALDFLKERGNYEVVVYEQYAAAPYENFMKLFKVLGVNPPEDYDNIINKYCFSSNEPSHKGEIIRNSKKMIDKWQTELTEQQVAELKNGFCLSRLEYYRDENDWINEKPIS